MSKILKINIGIVVLAPVLFILVMNFLSHTTTGENYRGLSLMIATCLLIILQVALNSILAIISFIKKDGNFKYYLLSILLTLLIGVPLCFGGAYLIK